MLNLFMIPFEYRNAEKAHEITAAFLFAVEATQAEQRLKKTLQLQHCEFVTLIDAIRVVNVDLWDDYINKNFGTFRDDLPAQSDWSDHRAREQVYLLPPVEVMHEAATKMADETGFHKAPERPPFCLKFRVRYGECDAQNVVFNARYGDYADLVSTEYFRALLGGYQALVELGYENQLVRLLTEWKAPARFDDVLRCWVAVGHIGQSSFTLHMRIERASDHQLIATIEATYVLVDARAFEKRVIPDELRASLKRGAPGVVIDQSGA